MDRYSGGLRRSNARQARDIGSEASQDRWSPSGCRRGSAGTHQSWNHEVDAVYFAALTKNKDIFELLLDRGADPIEALVPALWNARLDFAELALAHGASPNVPDDAERTAVHQVASRGNERMLRAVLDAGGDLKHRDKLGQTPLDVAKIMNRKKLIPMLL